MARFRFAWRILAALACLSGSRSLDSINLDLEILENIDLSRLGTPNLDRYEGSYEVEVDDACNYVLRVSFKKHPTDQVGNASPDFAGRCAPNSGTGNAPDGASWHAPRRHWMQFPDYVFATTGFNHVSLNWRPCGLPPKGFRQPSYHMNFYPVIPQYRVFWVCQEYKIPSVCRYNQTSFLGRGFFSIPRLERDASFLANMPNHFQPDENEPEAYPYEGLISYDSVGDTVPIPETTADWVLPTFLMSTYDGDIASWRAMLPHSFISGPNSSISFQSQFYNFQTMPRLPAFFNMTYNANNGVISVLLTGSAGMCGEGFEQAKQEQEANKRLRG